MNVQNEENFFFGDGKLFSDVHNVHQVHENGLDLSKAVDAQAENQKEATKKLETAQKTIDEALPKLKDEPGLLFTNDFIEALKVVGQDKQAWAIYRCKLKEAKPSGVSIATIDKEALPPDDYDRSDSVAGELIELANENGKLFYGLQSDEPFISTLIDGKAHTLAINSKPFFEWISFTYYTATKGTSGKGKSASESAIKQAAYALSGIAKHEGERERVYLRVADKDGRHYIFLGDEDMRVVEVTSMGWRILDNSPIKFWKPSAMRPLPIPQTGGNLDLMWKYVNIEPTQRPLLLAWMLESYRAETPKPVAALNAGQGGAKTFTQDKIRVLIDNNNANTRAAPKTVDDIFVSAGCNWLISYENLSHLPSQFQDAFCTLATGTGYAKRSLYTNADETTIKAKRPIIINSIPDVVTAQDLTDRVVMFDLPALESGYKEETELNAEWDRDKGLIFGALLDLFVKTMAKLPDVRLTKSTIRMVDFTRLGEAMMQAQGHGAGAFVELYKANRKESVSRAMESSPVAMAIVGMVNDHSGSSLTVYYGNYQKLLDDLTKFKRDSDGWPKSEKGLSNQIKRQLPALMLFGIKVVQDKERRNDGYHVKISKSGEQNGTNCERSIHSEHVTKSYTPGKKSFSDKGRI